MLQEKAAEINLLIILIHDPLFSE